MTDFNTVRCVPMHGYPLAPGDPLLEVEAATVTDRGGLTVVSSADLQIDGSYSVTVPANQRAMVIRALDASGEVVASAILEATGDAGATATATPMDSESSLETTVTTGVAAILAADDAVEPGDVAATVVDAWTTFRAAVQAEAGTVLSGTDADVAAALMVQASGSFATAY